MVDRIDGGMSFEDILEAGDDTNLYQSLISDVIDKIEFDTTVNTNSTFNALIEQLINGTENQQNRAADAIAEQLSKYEQQLDQVITSDLDAQDEVRQQLENLNIAAELAPENNNIQESPLYDLIATEDFKELYKDVDSA